MTAGARELTARATGLPPSDAAPLTQPAGPLRAFVDALALLGFDVTTLLEGAGLRRDQLADPDALIPCPAWDHVIGGAITQRRVSNLGARLAEVTPIGAFPLLDYLVVTTDAVGDALRQLQRYFHVVSARVSLTIAENDDTVCVLIEPGADSFIAQYECAIIVQHLRAETEGCLRVSSVSLMTEPEDRSHLERLFGCPVQTPATWSGLEFARSAMHVPLRRRDPVLRRVLEGQAASAHPRAAEGSSEGASARVGALLRTQIGRRVPRIEQVARQLAMSPRTLQRRLSAERSSYKALIDRARREAADRLLADTTLAVAEVGYVLGFSELSAFHRAFKRWRGVTPLDHRRALRNNRRDP